MRNIIKIGLLCSLSCVYMTSESRFYGCGRLGSDGPNDCSAAARQSEIARESAWYREALQALRAQGLHSESEINQIMSEMCNPQPASTVRPGSTQNPKANTAAGPARAHRLPRSSVEKARSSAQAQLAAIRLARQNDTTPREQDALLRNRGQSSAASGARGSGSGSSTNVLVSHPSAVLPPNSEIREEPLYRSIMELLAKWESSKPNDDELMISCIHQKEKEFAVIISKRIVGKAENISNGLSRMPELNTILETIIKKNIYPANDAFPDLLKHKDAYNITTVIHELRGIKDIYPNMDEAIRQSLDELITDLLEIENIYVDFLDKNIQNFSTATLALLREQKAAMTEHQILKGLN